MKKQFLLLILSLTLFNACSPAGGLEGYWYASDSEKASAAKKRILSILNQKFTHLSGDLGLFTNLERLIVQTNELKELPDCIDNLNKLERLNLSQNKLKDLPSSLKKLQTLKRLNLSKNNLESLPDVILELKNLEVLDIRQNNISELPQELSQLKKLNAIFIGGNNFTEEQRVLFRKWLPYTKIILRYDKGK